jgi:hypothetical protein
MRKAVTYLQSSAQLSTGRAVTSEVVLDVSGAPPRHLLDRLYPLIFPANQVANVTSSFDQWHSVVQDLNYEGYPVTLLLTALAHQITTSTTLTDREKAICSEQIAQCEVAVMEGASEVMQFTETIAFIHRTLAVR